MPEEPVLPPVYEGGPPAAPYVLPNHPRAMVAAVSATLAWTCCPFFPAVVALALARTARREIEAEPDRWAGENLVAVAWFLSWAHLVLCGVFAFFLVGTYWTVTSPG